MQLRIHLTGTLAVQRGERLVEAQSFRGRQSRLVFAMLAIGHHTAVPRDQLAEALWPSSFPRSWETDLSAIVSRLRRLLATLGMADPRVIRSALGCYELAPEEPLWLDVEAASSSLDVASASMGEGEHAAAVGAAVVARDIARRPFLPGDDSPWVEERRRELRATLVRADRVLAQAWSLQGDAEQAIRFAEEVIDLEPFNEEGYRTAIGLHAAAGNRAEALRVWERCREKLADELGVDPSAETESAYLTVLRSEGASPATKQGTVTLLFTDLVGSAELGVALGDEAAGEVRRAHFALLRDALAVRGGEEVKNLGDGLMVAFASTIDALACAVAMQQAVARHNRRAASELGVRVGLHAGEPIRDEGDYFGTSVAIAKRLCDAGDAGTILTSGLVRGLVGSRGAAAFRSRGAVRLKGLPEPMELFEVAWEPSSASAFPLPAPLAREEGSPFVGRADELAALVAELDASETGARLVLVSGEPGIGKTRLVSEFARTAHRAGAAVLLGRCGEETLLSFQPFVEALRHAVTSTSADELRAAAGRAAADLARLVPEVSERLPALAPTSTGDPETDRYRLFEAVVAYLTGLAAWRPVVVVLDDLHWADDPTLLLARHLARCRDAVPLLVVGTFRASETNRALDDLLSEVRRADAGGRITLSGLPATAVAQLVRLAGDDETALLARRIVAMTEGNPFFVKETVRHLVEVGALAERDEGWAAVEHVDQVGVPEGVKEVLGRRLARLSPEARAVLAVAAVAGREFALDVLERVSDLGEEALLEALDEAVAGRVVEEVPAELDRYTFSHALVRETLYEALTQSRRVRLHQRIGEALEELRPAPQPAAELAYHFTEAAPLGDPGKAIGYSVLAAEVATTDLAYEEAAVHLKRALRLHEDAGPPDGTALELLLRLGDAHKAAGRRDMAAACFNRGAALAKAAGDAEGLARAALGSVQPMAELGHSYGVHDPAAVELLRDALDAVGGDDSPLRARLLARLATESGFAIAGTHQRELAAEAIAVARRTGDRRVLLEGMVARLGEDFAHDQSLGLEIIELARELRDPAREFAGRIRLVWCLQMTGRMDEAGQELEAARTLAEDLRRPAYLFAVECGLTMHAYLAGRLDDAEAEGEQALRTGGEAIGETAVVMYSIQLFLIRWLQGRLAEIVGAIRASAEHFAHIPSYRAGLVHAYAELEDAAAVAAELERFGDDAFPEIPDDTNWLGTLACLAEGCAFVGDTGRSAVLYDLLFPFRERWAMFGSMGSFLGCVPYFLGLLAGAMGRAQESVEQLEWAMAEYDAKDTPPFGTKARYELARALVRRNETGDRERASGLATESLRVAEELGMQAVHRRASALVQELTNSATR